jgi:predicted TIM-barrel fold metal-dependent hydrolase
MIDRRQLVLGASALALGAPAFAAPSRAPMYDTHSHFFSNDFAKYPVNLGGGREGVEETRQRILSNPSTPENIMKLWAENGVEGGVGVQYNTAYRTDNSYLLASSDAHPDKIAAVVILDPVDPKTPAQLREMVKAHGITGVRFTGNPAADGTYAYLDGKPAETVWATANELGIAVELMYTPGRPTKAALDRIGLLAKANPRVKVVVDHIGWPGPQGAPDWGLIPAHLALKAQPNVYFKLTSINFRNFADNKQDGPSAVRRYVDVFGADRIMWGSDYGNTQGAFSEMVGAARQAVSKLTPAEQRKVLHDTGKRVFARKA